MSTDIPNMPIEKLLTEEMLDSIREKEGDVHVANAIVVMTGFDATGEPWFAMAFDDQAVIWNVVGHLHYAIEKVMYPEE